MRELSLSQSLFLSLPLSLFSNKQFLMILSKRPNDSLFWRLQDNRHTSLACQVILFVEENCNYLTQWLAFMWPSRPSSRTQLEKILGHVCIHAAWTQLFTAATLTIPPIRKPKCLTAGCRTHTCWCTYTHLLEGMNEKLIRSVTQGRSRREWEIDSQDLFFFQILSFKWNNCRQTLEN